MRILVLHQAVTENSTADDLDVLVQAEAVSHSLRSLGHHPVILPCDLDLSDLRNQLTVIKPDAVFNLVESLDGSGRLIHLVPAMLQAMDTAFTGSDSNALLKTSHKTIAKMEMIRAGLPTPDWIGPFPANCRNECRQTTPYIGQAPRKWIIKSLWEHASAGMDDNAVVDADARTVENLARNRAPGLGGNAFAETYVDGREFNLPLLQDGESFQVLPPAEIVFEGYPQGKPRIVDYRAKWETDSYEYLHTVRRFDFPESDACLLQTLSSLAIRCSEVFNLRGYARVDFRVDVHGRPWILEINANPCISPDAGFAAAVDRAGMSFDQAVQRIVAAAVSGRCKTASRAIPICRPCLPAAEVENTPGADTIRFEYEPMPDDRHHVQRLIESTNFFSRDEIDVAEELVKERLEKGDRSGYFFVLVRHCGRLIGYGAYGPIPCSVSSYDLYWIAVDPDFQGQGLGRRISNEIERLVRQSGGTRLYAETSGRPLYAPTRKFYQSCGYRAESVLKDFYDTGDDKVTFGKVLC